MCRVWAIIYDGLRSYTMVGVCVGGTASKQRPRGGVVPESYGDGSDANTAAFRPAGIGRASLAHNGSRSSGANSLPVRRPPYMRPLIRIKGKGGGSHSPAHTMTRALIISASSVVYMMCA